MRRQVELAFLFCAMSAACGGGGSVSSLAGELQVTIADGVDGRAEVWPSMQRGDGRAVRLDLSRLAADDPARRTIEAMSTKERLAVDVECDPVASTEAFCAVSRLTVSSVQARREALTVTGNRAVPVVLCRYAGDPTMPAARDDFTGLMVHYEWSADHYYKQVSRGAFGFAGSYAVGWLDLPKSESGYIVQYQGQSYLDLESVRRDCLAAAQAQIHFPDYSTLAVVLNHTYEPASSIGGIEGDATLTLNGTTKTYAVVTMWGDSSREATNWMHELGHTLGLMHSGGGDCAGDEWAQRYGNSFDPMGAARTYAYSSPWGTFWPPHLNAYHKVWLGWLSTTRRYIQYSSGSTYVEAHGNPVSSTNKLLLHVPITNTNTYYAVESRRFGPPGSYEKALGSEGVVIHHVDPNRQDNPSLFMNPRRECEPWALAMRSGQSFSDHVAGIRLSVVSEDANGATVNVQRAAPVTITAEPIGNGSISVAPKGAGKSCVGAKCYYTFFPNTAVTMTANPSSGYAFKSWSGCPNPQGNVCYDVASAFHGVTASFALASGCRVDAACKSACLNACYGDGTPPAVCQNACTNECTICN